VHYCLQSVSSTRGNVSFKAWQKWYYNVCPVSLAFPAKVRDTEIYQKKVRGDTEIYQKKGKTQVKMTAESCGFKGWVNSFSHDILHISGLGSAARLEARSQIQAINSELEP
jgi:hypothetical protein